MFKYIFSFAIACSVLSCTSEEEPKSEKVAVTDTENVDQKSNKEYDPSSVISRSEEFFDWYVENNRMLYKMRSACIGAENGYHAVDKKKLKTYISWLRETNFFSEDFISSEHDRWSTECAEIMREKARKKERLVGPPPCVFEGDVFFKIQERPTQEMIDSLSFEVSEQTDNSALVSYDGNNSLNWSYQKGSWTIDAWPN